MQFILKTTFKVSPEKIYNSWLNSEEHSKMTGGTAKCSDKVGDRFTAWDGYIIGKNIELEPYHRIVQSWRTTDFKVGDADSIIELLLEKKEDLTELTLIHSNVPEGEADYKKGWEEHYFEPMRAYFQNM